MRIQTAIAATGLTSLLIFAAALAQPATSPAPTAPVPTATKPASTQPAIAQSATAAATTFPAATTNPAFGERVSDLAQLVARTSAPSSSVWTASACLFEAAARHDAEEPRYRRLQVDTLIRAGDMERATE